MPPGRWSFQQFFRKQWCTNELMRARILGVLCALAASAALAPAEEAAPLIKVEDALTRARQYAGQIQTANTAVRQAAEDHVQARAGQLPSVTALNQFIYTQGNGTPSGVFVANDGVHVYNEQAQVHEEALAFF